VTSTISVAWPASLSEQVVGANPTYLHAARSYSLCGILCQRWRDMRGSAMGPCWLKTAGHDVGGASGT
jgi:hypothetical protein